MKVIAKRQKDGFLIPLIPGLEDKDEIEVVIEEDSFKGLLMTNIDISDYYKSDQYYIDRAKYTEGDVE